MTLVAWSDMVHTALAAADRLVQRGVGVEVVDLRTLAPLDIETLLASCRRTGRLVVAHESCRTAGLGAEIVARVAEQLHGQLRAPIRRVTTPDVILPANTALEKALVPDTDSVVAAIENLLGG